MKPTSSPTRASRTAGSELSEFAILLPFLLLTILLVSEGAAAVAAHQVLNNAAREGARLSSVQGELVEDVQERVLAYAAANNITLTDGQVTVNQNIAVPVSGGACSVAYPCIPASLVTVTYSFSLPIPLGTLRAVPLTASAEMRNLY